MNLSPNATAVWTAFHDAVEESLREGGALEALRGFGARLAENVLRIAGVLTLFEGAEIVTERVMRRAVMLGDYYAGEAARSAERAAISTDIMHAERCRRWLIENWEKRTVKLRDLVQGGPRPRDKRKVETAVQILVEHGWLVQLDGKTYSIEGRDG